MPTSIDILRIRKILGIKEWSSPTQFGADGWYLINKRQKSSIIVTAADHDGEEWIHASIAMDHETPSYNDLQLLHKAVFGERYSYQVFTPSDKHVNIHEHALHLWGKADGKPVLPEFSQGGSI